MADRKDHNKDDFLNKKGNVLLMSKVEKETEKFLAEIRAVFKNERLLNGKPPSDKILITLSPELRKHLQEMAKLDPVPVEKMQKAIEKEASKKKHKPK